MTEQRLSTRDRLVDAALTLFWDRGYRATSMNDILREAGAHGGSLYYFFKSKEQILVAVLDRYLEMLQPVVIEPIFSSQPDPIARVFALLDGYRNQLHESGCERGCPIGNLALEVGDESEEVRERIAANFLAWRRAIERCFEDAADRLVSEADPAALASYALAVMEGAVMQARTFRSLAPFDEAVDMLRDHVDRLQVSEEALN